MKKIIDIQYSNDFQTVQDLQVGDFAVCEKQYMQIEYIARTNPASESCDLQGYIITLIDIRGERITVQRVLSCNTDDLPF